MSKELSVKEQQALAVSEMMDADWGNGGLVAKDIIIPRINVMQPMSEKVTGGKAAFGEVRESLNNTLLGGFGTAPLEIVPFLMEKVFIVFDSSDPEDKKYLRMEPITPSNEDAAYEDEEKDDKGDYRKISRFRTMNFYVLLADELKMGTAIPYLLSLSKTSLQAGKKLATQMYVKNINSGKLPASVICSLSVDKQSQDKKTWAVFDIAPSKETPVEWTLEAFKWLKTIKAGKTKVDTEAFVEESKEKAVNKVDLSEPTEF